MPDGTSRTFRFALIGVRGDWVYLRYLIALIFQCCLFIMEHVID